MAFFNKIDCAISEIELVSYTPYGITIYLKSKKLYNISGLINSAELANAIMKLLVFPVDKTAEQLKVDLERLKTSRKKRLIACICAMLMMFINIFIAVFLTGEREMYDFTRRDWIVWWIMAGVELITVILTFYFAAKAGKVNAPITVCKFALQKALIEASPLPLGNAIGVYTDYAYTVRIVLFGFPDNNKIYYTVEKINNDNLIKVFTSNLLESKEILSEDLNSLSNITEKLCK